MRTTITLEADSFNYPTREERKKISSLIPKIERLKVDYKSATIEILQGSSSRNAIKDEDIYWWSNCLNNRLGKLEETFVYVQTHYLREQEMKGKEYKNRHTDKLLLEYFIEIFYYYFFSAKDLVGQLLNIVYDLELKENQIFLKEEFVKKIKSIEIRSALADFLINTKESYNIRNSFSHRFTPTHQDSRALRNIIAEDNKINFYSPEEIQMTTFVNDIENLMKHLGYLMKKLSIEIK